MPRVSGLSLSSYLRKDIVLTLVSLTDRANECRVCRHNTFAYEHLPNTALQA